MPIDYNDPNWVNNDTSNDAQRAWWNWRAGQATTQQQQWASMPAPFGRYPSGEPMPDPTTLYGGYGSRGARSQALYQPNAQFPTIGGTGGAAPTTPAPGTGVQVGQYVPPATTPGTPAPAPVVTNSTFPGPGGNLGGNTAQGQPKVGPIVPGQMPDYMTNLVQKLSAPTMNPVAPLNTAPTTTSAATGIVSPTMTLENTTTNPDGTPKGGGVANDPGTPTNDPTKPGGTGAPNTTTTSNGGDPANVLHNWSTTGLNPQMQGLFDSMLKYFTTTVMPGMTNASLPGTVAPLNADQLAGQGHYRAVADNFGDLYNPTYATQQQMLANANNPMANPAVKSMMEENAKSINQAASDPGGIWSQIRDGAVTSGQFGGSRQGIAEGIAAGRIADQIKSGNTSILNNAWNTGQQYGSKAIDQANPLAALWKTPGDLYSAVGQQNYDVSSNTLKDKLQQYLFQYMQPQQVMSMFSGLFGQGAPTGLVNHTSINYPQFQTELGGNGSSNAAGGLTLAALLASLFK